MPSNYIQVFILQPIKNETTMMMKTVIKTLFVKFAGSIYDNRQTTLILKVMSMWFGCELSHLLINKFMFVVFYIDESKNPNYINYFSNSKAEYERILDEKFSWITFQSIKRVI